MTRRANILARALSDADLARHLDLLASYGIAGRRVDVAEACAVAGEEAIWLTCERSCVPVLALLSPAWSAERIGAFASLVTREHVQRTCRAKGLAVADKPVATIEGLVWDGRFSLTLADGSLPLATQVATAGDLCLRLGLARGYLRLDLGTGGRTVVDASLTTGDAAAILHSRRAGVCPIWTAICLAASRRPLIPITAAPALAPAHDGAVAPRLEHAAS